MADDLDSIVSSILQKDRGDQAMQIRNNVQFAAGANPEQEASYQHLAKFVGVPVDTVRAQPEAIKTEAVLQQFDADRLAIEFPHTAKFLTSLDNTRLVVDDIHGMTAVEKAVKFLGENVLQAPQGPTPSVLSVLTGLARALPQGAELVRQGLRRQFADAAGLDEMGIDSARKYAQAQADVADSTPAFDSRTAAGLYSGGTSLLRQLPGMAASIITRSSVPMLAAAGVQTEAEAYGKYRGRGATPGEAILGASGEGVVEVATELIPMGFLVQSLGKVGAGEFIKGFVGRELATEQLATVLQDALDTAIANPDKTWGQYAEERPDAAYQTFLATLVQSGALTALHTGMLQVARRAEQADTATQANNALQAISQVATAGKLLERDPEAFHQFVEQVAPDAEVYIDARTLVGALQQSGMPLEDVHRLMPDVGKQINEALDSEGDVRIPVADYATYIAGGPADAMILPRLKAEVGGMTYADAQVFYQTQGEELKVKAAEIAAEKSNDNLFQESSASVERELLAQLQTANRFTPDVNASYAKLASAFYTVQAERLGITPEEMYVAHPLQIKAETLLGSKLLDHVVYNQTYEISDQRSADGTLHATALADLRREAAGLERPRSGTFLTVTEDGRAVATGEPGTRIPKTFTRFAEKHGLTFDARRVLHKTVTTVGKPVGDMSVGGGKGIISPKSEPMPLAYRESGAMYFGEQGAFIDRTGKKLFQGNRGAFDPESGTLALLKEADLSTFLHEMGHFNLEVLADIASQGDSPAEIKQDMDKLLGWFGVADLPTWHNLEFEEKRSYHEQFARGFEAYLFEGKSPSVELSGLFARFRAWLLNVYRHIRSLNVEINDEVRGVMDRMLASEDAIKSAEQVRGYDPLFKSAEAAGMTPEQWADYQRLGADATEHAIENMERRSLGNMRWLANAKSRALKDLQKEAASKRREVHGEVTKEVWSQPVYQAWQFLTAKENVEPVAATLKAKAPEGVDMSRDSMLVAIAKLGGMRKDQLVDEWGMDPKERPEAGQFGKPVVRAEGKGKTLDEMGMALADLGYLSTDEHGKHDQREFEDKFFNELRGSSEYSNQADYDFLQRKPPDEDLRLRNGGRLDTDLVRLVPGGNTVENLRMTKKGGLNPDLVAELFGFSSGNEMVRTLADAQRPRDVIEGMTDQRMLERYGELSDMQAVERAAEAAIHNEARAKFVATELRALTKATGPVQMIARAAKESAEQAVAAKRVRELRPAQYAAAESRAARAADKALAANDILNAAIEKRAQLLNNQLARATEGAVEEVRRGVDYLKKFDSDGSRKALDAEYLEQVDALLDRFDLRRGQSLKAIDKRTTLAAWLESQREMGLEPDIPEQLQNEAVRKHYKDMTVAEFRGLLDTVKQIEHLGRLKHRLLTAQDQRAYEAVRDEIAASVRANAQGRTADTRTPTTNAGRALQGLKRFWAAHRKAAMLARTLDGEQDGGPMWEYFVRSANERGDTEATMRAEATQQLSAIIAPVFTLGKMGGAGMFFPSIRRSLNREARLAIALNTGNAGNLQRLLGGEGWTVEQIKPVLDTLTAAEWQAVQAVWDHFESYRPQIAAKETRVYGKEPVWVEPMPVTVHGVGGQLVELRGGYYPIKYDPAASQRAEEHLDAESARRQLQGAYTSATTRRSFTKTRVEEVTGRPLLYSLSGLYSGVQDVIHDLAWHEWLIDANRLMRSKTIDHAIRNHYGPEVKGQFKDWINDVAEGERGAANAGEAALSRLRQGVSAAGLGFNVVSALMQPLGITQSIVRVGASWVGNGVARYIAHPLAATKETNAKSEFMANRSRTRFRELNELRNQVQDETKTEAAIKSGLYFLMMRFQQAVDVPTWLGAYEKAISEGNNEPRSSALADQAVIDSQGGGMLKDLSAIERGGPALKLFTVFYSFMNTAFNLGVNAAMSPASRAKKAVDLIMIGVVPPMLALALKQAITPGGGDDDWDLDKLAKKLLAAQIDYLMGLMVVAREFSEAGKTLTGANDFGRDYTGPAGLRLVSDSVALAKQAHQGEFDAAFRKATINVVGDVFGLPAAQVNRTITGAEALADNKTENPAALVFGYRK